MAAPTIQAGACRWRSAVAWRQRLAAAAVALPPSSTSWSHLDVQRPCEQQQYRQHVATAASGAAVSSSSTGSSSGRQPPPQQQQDTKHMHMDEVLYAYLLQHTREPAVLAALRAETEAQFPAAARMAISPDQGAFLAWLVRTLGARRVIEVGVFAGYSSIAIALALPPGGTLVACDRDPWAMALAREYWHKAGVADKVDERLGPAAATLDALLADPAQHGGYDFAFVDANKKGYRAYYEQVLQLVRPGGVIAIDNMLWYGRVADTGDNNGTTVALRELNDFLVKDERVAFSLATVGDGMAMCTKL